MSTSLTLLFVSLLFCLLIGIPVGFSIGISCMVYLYVGGYPPIDIMVMRMVNGCKSFSMLAMPLFVFSGALMVYGSTPRLMKFANMLLRRVPGGMGATAMAACGFFGAVSGSGVASAAAIGSICGPEMVRQGYSKGLTAGLIAAGGTMACIIPPSIVMVVYAGCTGCSIGDMFVGGVVPGTLTILALIILNGYFAKKHGVGDQESMHYSAKEKLKITLDALLPLAMPVFVLGSVFAGLATPTEAGVIAVVYSFILAIFVYRELSFKEFFNVAANSVITTAVIMIIISAATPFGWIMSVENVPALFSGWITSVTTNPVIILGFFFIILLILGCFMETVCVILLVTPILLPIAQQLGIDTVHFGIAMLMNLMVGSLTPPLSVNLFTSCRVLNMRIDEAFPDTLYVIGVVTIMALLTLIFPDISLGLVRLLR